ncbi:hypothetical protein L249_5855 [Ophiocordyceps polyrhachis-furcata BCC 54312]|uniref:Protein kinase domain-containing protein n=1 Tax=Ophiocordyceps polyrhachis-furcata BCC 54312 TaxID=1330021 RepID=A0A367L0G0_9HYPO|nr:hypothetical protein L249_5855 [Ophiocordyceps polyrhachis-furcata BCC 54312]
MATASPTPMTTGSGSVRMMAHRQVLRRMPSRSAIGKGEMAQQQQQQPRYRDESSEDEIPVPMKLSALTKALLDDGGEQRAVSSPRTSRRRASPSSQERLPQPRAVSVQPESSPALRKRVVRLSSTPQSLNRPLPHKRRSASVSRPAIRSSSQAEDRPTSRQQESRSDVNTPAHGERIVRINAGSSSSGIGRRVGSSASSSARSRLDHNGGVDTEADIAARSSANTSHGSVSRHPSAPRSRGDDNNGHLQNSMRIKRVGKIPGSFLSGPARRGRRRQSEEEEEEGEGEEEADGNNEGDLLVSAGPDEPRPVPEASPPHYADAIRSFKSGSPVSGVATARALLRRQASTPEPEPEPGQVEKRAQVVETAPAYDQENKMAVRRGKKPSMEQLPLRGAADNMVKPFNNSNNSNNHNNSNADRRPLSELAHNTPHRPAPPPPPKMSVLEAATAARSKQRRGVLRVNGKSYTRLDCLGRGGSAKVYRVTAENGNMFALKRVSLDHADETTVRGYKGEMDLLKRLASVDRVIKLFDHELNGEKQVLTLLMELGELDLNKLMTSRQNPENARFDPVFVRFYWKEMLECLEAVHRHDIVHSDLKPANFVLVRGRLKLIDFGIANAIQTDETVNVHRETQIGTPNYMSPESLMDANSSSGNRGPRLMKLGKPSDVWSLGCILYQMVYGLPPFGHIPNQMARCQAIVNWDHAIEFHSRAVGGVPVPPSLLRTMRRCLSREQHLRPTCAELLLPTDGFLYPSETAEGALPVDEELLARLVQSVVSRCRERMPSEAEALASWPQAYWASIRKAANNRS